MRTIKFRAWDGRRLKIVSPEIGDDVNGLNIAISIVQNRYGNLMQYTGIKDKHGIEIYEGDLISFSTADRDYIPHVVYFGDGCFHVKIRSGSEKGYEPCLCLLQHIEVTGNIHETPQKT